MAERKETWKKFAIICHRCGRHEDEGVRINPMYGMKTMILCPCGESEEYEPMRIKGDV